MQQTKLLSLRRICWQTEEYQSLKAAERVHASATQQAFYTALRLTAHSYGSLRRVSFTPFRVPRPRLRHPAGPSVAAGQPLVEDFEDVRIDDLLPAFGQFGRCRRLAFGLFHDQGLGTRNGTLVKTS